MITATPIDLRSGTVTRPSAQTVNALQEQVAAMPGKEAAAEWHDGEPGCVAHAHPSWRRCDRQPRVARRLARNRGLGPRGRGVLLDALGPRTIRAVTHLDVSRDQCRQAADVLVELADGSPIDASKPFDIGRDVAS
jgi:hypothetical protein